MDSFPWCRHSSGANTILTSILMYGEFRKVAQDDQMVNGRVHQDTGLGGWLQHILPNHLPLPSVVKGQWLSLLSLQEVFHYPSCDPSTTRALSVSRFRFGNV